MQEKSENFEKILEFEKSEILEFKKILKLCISKFWEFK